MRYIKTQVGIYEVEEWFKPLENDMVYIPSEGLNKILSQADTIKELCDEFVDTSELRGTNTGGWLYDEFDSDNKCLVYYEHDERKTIQLNEFDDLSKIYGAIWTDKGLIYVAKMNDKGELELL